MYDSLTDVTFVMIVARRFVIFFTILAMVGWGWVCYIWLLRLIMPIRMGAFFHQQMNMVGERGSAETNGLAVAFGQNEALGLECIGWICFAAAYLVAWGCWIVKARMLHAIIVALGLSASLLLTIGRFKDSFWNLVTLELVLMVLCLPLMVVAGFIFLRVTRLHPSLLEAVEKGGRN